MATDLLVPTEQTPPASPEESGTVPKGGPYWLRRTGIHLGVIAVFTLPSIVLWWHAWTGGAASAVRCSCMDPGQQVWFIAWPAYALAHGHNPFFST
jgi:hypothetical protein